MAEAQEADRTTRYSSIGTTTTVSSERPQRWSRIKLSGGAETFVRAGHRNPLYLFACHLEWRTNRNLDAYKELLAGLDDSDERNRTVADW